jgi:hypothetical protein
LFSSPAGFLLSGYFCYSGVFGGTASFCSFFSSSFFGSAALTSSFLGAALTSSFALGSAYFGTSAGGGCCCFGYSLAFFLGD